MSMRYLFAAALVAAAAFASPAAALTPEEKMETCKIGADAQKLTGTKRKKFLARCMADSDAQSKGK
jgi:psiF repeat